MRNLLAILCAVLSAGCGTIYTIEPETGPYAHMPAPVLAEASLDGPIVENVRIAGWNTFISTSSSFGESVLVNPAARHEQPRGFAREDADGSGAHFGERAIDAAVQGSGAIGVHGPEPYEHRARGRRYAGARATRHGPEIVEKRHVGEPGVEARGHAGDQHTRVLGI